MYKFKVINRQDRQTLGQFETRTEAERYINRFGASAHIVNLAPICDCKRYMYRCNIAESGWCCIECGH